jgi:hypothetical protein
MLIQNEILYEIKNGNYNIVILKDGTKVRYCHHKKFEPQHPESIDLKITNQCDLNCPFCHEDSKPDGQHGDLNIAMENLAMLPAGTEIAIGGGNPLSHPGLKMFLEWCRYKSFICNITINQQHFYQLEKLQLIKDNLIYGLGISYQKDVPLPYINYKHVVIHLICGIHNLNDIISCVNRFGVVLILGYKDVGRGKTRQCFNKQYFDNLKNNLYVLLNQPGKIIFDNLSIQQLGLQKYFNKKDWLEFYMGDDGQFTMYYDLVRDVFCQSSNDKENCRSAKNLNIVDYFNGGIG